MFDPVQAEDFRTYERLAIEASIALKGVSPMDNETKISVAGLRPNVFAKGMIGDLVASVECPGEILEEYNDAKKASNMVKANKLYAEGKVLEAANLGHVKAMGKMAYNFRRGVGGFEVDEDKAFDFATKSAKEDDGCGMFQLAYCYDGGIGVDKDWVKALKWYERCADEYDDSANNNSGNIYYDGGYGVLQNYEKAAECYRKAADLGDSGGQNNLADMYFDGEGVAQSFVEAHKWFKRAADQDNDEAQYRLGKMLIKKQGGNEGSFGEGIVLIEKAAGQGNKGATSYLKKVETYSKKLA